jgi:predicted aldo/keto reductase-like oxidoreductase
VKSKLDLIKGGFMSSKPSRRQFLQAGIALPAAGLAASNRPMAALQEPPKTKEPPKVVYRTLGKTDLKPSGVGYGIGYVPYTDVVARALDMGINYFDTARDYKDSERIFSGVIKGRQRDKIIIATKSPSYSKKLILRDLDTSLSELGTDYVDVWHLHARDSPASIPDQALEAMQIAKQSGKARYLGFSCHKPYAMVDFVINTKVFDVMQMTYSYPIGGRLRNDAVDKLREAGVGIIAMKVVVAVSGLNLADFSGKSRTTGEGPLAGIKWVLTNPGIGTTVPHMKTIEELEMNFRAMSEPYTEADEQLLYTLNEQIRPYYCRMCYECEGKCPKGMPVTDVLRFLAYHDFCGDLYQAVNSFRGLAREIRDVRCKDCSVCAVQCPNGVHVQERMIRAQELLA